MELVVDTSVLIAVVANEPEKATLVKQTRGSDLIAPGSVHWEVGNAFAAMLKRGRVTLDQAERALAAYERIPLRFIDIDLVTAMQLAAELDIYAYDAYVIACARRQQCRVLSLDRGLIRAARAANVSVLEVSE